jgi:hypothetical protein
MEAAQMGTAGVARPPSDREQRSQAACVLLEQVNAQELDFAGGSMSSVEPRRGNMHSPNANGSM